MSAALTALIACLALLLGLGAGWWLARRQVLAEARAESRAELATLTERARGLAEAQVRADGLGAELSMAKARLAAVQTQLSAERQQSAEKIELLQQTREELSNQFKTLANDILEEKSKRFAEQNQASLGHLLDPLRLRLADFQGKVEQFYDAEGKQRSALSQQVGQLMDLNKLLGEEARSLTNALKGSNKAQGNWGELILERVLEASGLRRGIEYHVQQNHTREDGSRAQPDVIIHLPEERKLVVDAKVSLLAYEECVAAETDEARAIAQRRHLASVRAHIEGLAARNYQQLYSLKTLDFVLMFVPIEPAFMLAVGADEQLFMDAWKRNVLLVSPSTLLFVVRTVAHLWRQEQQNRNAQEIARRGADLYDKLSAFVGDLEEIGKSLDRAQKSYGEAFKRLKAGRGNAIAQAERLRELGVKPTKSFSQNALEGALPDPDLLPTGPPEHSGLPPLSG
ncbi:DNA recombination protein RmuC [Xylophilus rhododendri]|uniref:DNA recombination protein RmuC n=1 Tax=Xylophilus rhododendri TaxID=2697032 RepID=A0A857J592_9BURK|nr:DNA recombination protein RmuC [Xylophilus rhododendri]QHI98005.1 DNA recombination protein RmuC [Xylophilus rhododendri]